MSTPPDIDGTRFTLPPFGITDLYCAVIVVLPLLAIHVVLWVVFTLLCLPALGACWLHRRRLPRPLRRVEGGRGSSFARLTSTTAVLATPALALLWSWTFLVWTWSLVSSLPFALLVRGLLQRRWKMIGNNLARVHSHCGWPAWRWDDVCRCFIGSMDRQGFFEFAIGKPFWGGIGSLLLQPVFKYALSCNVFLDELEVKFANEWIDPPQPDASAEYLHEFTKVFVCTALHSEAQRDFIDDESTFAAHYPYPDGDGRTVTGMQFSEADKGVYFTKVSHDPDLESLREQGSPIRRADVVSCVFHVQILYTNPFHPLVGDVFVDVTRDSRVEHQMHCVASRSTYFGNLAYDMAHRLFATTFLRGALKYFDRFGLEP